MDEEQIMANRDTGFGKSQKETDKLNKKKSEGLDIKITKGTVYGEKDMQDLLSKKDELVKQKTKDGRNQYQVEVQKLKDKLKAETKRAKAQGFKSLKYKFSDLLNHVKKQEREGTFDRGAEGKKKNKLRKKMVGKPKKEFTKGRHKDSDVDKVFDKDLKPMDRDVMVSEIVAMTGTKKKPKTGPKAGSR